MGSSKTLFAAGALSVGVVASAALLFAARVDPTTAGFVLLVVVLVLASRLGAGLGVLAAVVATACYNFLFFEPFFTFHVADPRNWIVLAAFLAAAIVAGRLLAKARHEAEQAAHRQAETRRLAELARELLALDPLRLDAVVTVVQRILGAQAGGLRLAGDTVTGGRTVGAHVGSELDDSTATVVPLLLAGREIGTLALAGTNADPGVVRGAADMVALAVERARLAEQGARIEAIKAAEVLKTALLRAISHDLRSPLTAMRLDADALQRSPNLDANERRRAEALSREREQLERRIGNLLALARLEGGAIAPQPTATPPGELIRATREALAQTLADRKVEVRVASTCPDALVDPALVVEVLVNLVENAAAVTPLDLPIEIEVEDLGGQLAIEVVDHGPGLPAEVVAALAAGRPVVGEGGRVGLGLSIARDLARACGGSLALEADRERGTRARLVIPAALDLEGVDP